MSAASLVTDPIIDPLITCGILVCLTGLFLWMEYRRRTAFLPVRIISVLLMMLGLAGFLIRPLHKVSESERVILLTPGYSTSQADSLVNVYPSWNVIHTPGARALNGSRKMNGDFSGKEVGFVLGRGLAADSLEMFQLRGYQFLASPYPEGIIQLSMPADVLPHRKHKIKGVYNNLSGKPATIILEGPGGREDSVTLAEPGHLLFTLSFLTRQEGKHLFSIYVNGKKQGDIPVPVQPHQPLEILFLQSYPTFETRYLKHFLSRHHRMVVRYQLSKNRYRHEFINRAPAAIGPLTKNLLSEFDAVIIDTEMLQSLSYAEKTNLYSAIDEGLGMIPIFNSAPSAVQGLAPLKFNRHASDTARVNPSGKRRHILPTWPSAVHSLGDIVPLLQNKQRILSGYKYRRIGRVGFHLLQETYRLSLQGDSTAYSMIWTPLLEAIARSTASDVKVNARSDFPYFMNRAVDIEIISSARQPALSIDQIAIPLKENITVDNIWEGTFWPAQRGWNFLHIEGDSARMHLFVSDVGEWRTLVLANNRNNTEALATNAAHEVSSKYRYISVAPWLFYFLFLSAAAMLWVLPKV